MEIFKTKISDKKLSHYAECSKTEQIIKSDRKLKNKDLSYTYKKNCGVPFAGFNSRGPNRSPVFGTFDFPLVKVRRESNFPPYIRLTLEYKCLGLMTWYLKLKLSNSYVTIVFTWNLQFPNRVVPIWAQKFSRFTRITP